MSRTIGALRIFAFALLLVAIFQGTALAVDVVVDGERRDFYTTDVVHNLTVKNGGVVYLFGTNVKGNLKIVGTGSYVGSATGCLVDGDVIVEDSGRLTFYYSEIRGNLKGIKNGHINFLISKVLGDIVITEGADFNADYGPNEVGGDFKYRNGSGARLNWFTVKGNVKFVGNKSMSYIWVKNSYIIGSLHVIDNDMGMFISITNNTIGGDMIVLDNSPPPGISGNSVNGKVIVN